MKVRVMLKDPDTMQDSVDDAFADEVCPEGVADDEWDDIRASRADKAKKAITDKWMEYGEYLEVEFDLEAMTATVIERGK